MNQRFGKPTVFAILLSGVMLTCPTVFAAGDGPVQVKQKMTDIERLRDFDRELGRSPVDAYVDRVWHLIPGLSGWKLLQGQSEAATKRINDGKLHLVWEMIPPKVSLSTLPAEPIYRGPGTEKSISLMINVSWGEEYVPAMLTTLRNAHVHATFFLDGQWVKAHPELAKQIVKEGHAIGSHGTGHPDFRKLSNGQLANQIDGTNQTIDSICGVNVRTIAPPSGAFDERLVKMAKERNMYTILWTADTVDWRKPPADVILGRAKRGLAPGCFLLMHPTQPTAEALPKILKMIEASGYYTKTIDEVVAERPAVQPPTTLSALQ